MGQKTRPVWKQIRIRPEWIEWLRTASQKNPTFSPNMDLATMKEPKLLELACRIAVSHISGWLFEKIEEDVAKIIQAERRDAILTVANHLGGRVQTNEDGTITVMTRRKESPNLTLPLDSQFKLPTMLN